MGGGRSYMAPPVRKKKERLLSGKIKSLREIWSERARERLKTGA